MSSGHPNDCRVPVECRLPPITVCTFCNGPVSYVENKVVYGKNYGNNPMIYHCDDCGAFVGTHPGTNIPLGTLADGETREARKRAHSAFDHIWKNSRGKVTRGAAYRWLAGMLKIPRHACHMAWFDAATCKRVVQFSLARLRAEEN